MRLHQALSWDGLARPCWGVDTGGGSRLLAFLLLRAMTL